ncbi:hypothetical protein ACFOHK_09795 [Falsigemmobacter intermedius]|uniref:Uncharacterized protein n=1 Tax=Falsigemmobacter intermedius TaxID=1553448 RepID=A0A3S3YKG7_9RHOB|nr:hypothetical protein [Falsigemmobacter intermedius]RWY41770.1 hypothetical protein EP867_08535 [Falsigemmobacter intermedius]
MRLIKVLLVLIVLAFAGLTGFAYFGDMTPEPAQVSQPLELAPAETRPEASPSTAAGTDGN